MNPCPCGYLGDPSGRCHCSPARIGQYRAQHLGPLLDRIDLRIEVPRCPNRRSPTARRGANRARRLQVACREARTRQLARAGKLNSQLSVKEIGQFCSLDAGGRRLLWQSRAKLGMSLRSYHRTLRVARTIADLEGERFDPRACTWPKRFSSSALMESV